MAALYNAENGGEIGAGMTDREALDAARDFAIEREEDMDFSDELIERLQGRYPDLSEAIRTAAITGGMVEAARKAEPTGYQDDGDWIGVRVYIAPRADYRFSGADHSPWAWVRLSNLEGSIIFSEQAEEPVEPV